MGIFLLDDLDINSPDFTSLALQRVTSNSGLGYMVINDAIANLSFDLTQTDAQGHVTTRYEFTPEEVSALEYAQQNKVMIVASAGNTGGLMSALGQSSQHFDNIITVGSGDSQGRYDYSSYGQGLDIIADGGTGEHPALANMGEGLGAMAGTSVAAAKVTGAVSQVWAANPGLNYRQVINILEKTATDVGTPGWDAQTGAGLLNVGAAVQLAKGVKWGKTVIVNGVKVSLVLLGMLSTVNLVRGVLLDSSDALEEQSQVVGEVESDPSMATERANCAPSSLNGFMPCPSPSRSPSPSPSPTPPPRDVSKMSYQEKLWEAMKIGITEKVPKAVRDMFSDPRVNALMVAFLLIMVALHKLFPSVMLKIDQLLTKLMVLQLGFDLSQFLVKADKARDEAGLNSAADSFASFAINLGSLGLLKVLQLLKFVLSVLPKLLKVVKNVDDVMVLAKLLDAVKDTETLIKLLDAVGNDAPALLRLVKKVPKPNQLLALLKKVPNPVQLENLLGKVSDPTKLLNLLNRVKNNASLLEELLNLVGNNTPLLEKLLNQTKNNTSVLKELLNQVSNNASLLSDLLSWVGNNTSTLGGLLNRVRNNAPVLQRLLIQVKNNVPILDNLLIRVKNNAPLLETLLTQVSNNAPALQRLLIQVENNVPVLQRLLNQVGNNALVLEKLLTRVGNNTAMLERLLNAVGNNTLTLQRLLTRVKNNGSILEELLSAVGNDIPILERLLNHTRNNAPVLKGLLNQFSNDASKLEEMLKLVNNNVSRLQNLLNLVGGDVARLENFLSLVKNNASLLERLLSHRGNNRNINSLDDLESLIKNIGDPVELERMLLPPYTENLIWNGQIGAAPSNAVDVVKFARTHNGAAQQNFRGNRNYVNDGQERGMFLPVKDSLGNQITYREYDVNIKIQGVPRDKERVVIGSDGRTYYTSDHYISFILFP